MKERILILVKAAPTWSNKYKKYQVCTAGVTEEGEWRRLFPFPEDVMHGKDIKLWDIVEFETEIPVKDPRPESRKINFKTIKKIGRMEGREKRREFLNGITESGLGQALEEKRSLILLKPEIVSFSVRKPKKREPIQFTLEGTPFKKHPYGDIDLIYRLNCQEPCKFCENQPHRMKCFDWGANVLYKRYKDEKEARKKVKDMCYNKMKYEYDNWFALGTHSRWPFSKWMIVGLLWMKKV